MRGRLVAALVVARAAVEPAVRLASLPRLMKACQHNAVPEPLDAAAVVEVIRAVEAVWRRLPRGSGTCLTRSLWRLFAARHVGVPLRFVVGVRLSSTKQVEAHAWLEFDGALFMESNPTMPAAFTPIFSDPPMSSPSPSTSNSTLPEDLRFV